MNAYEVPEEKPDEIPTLDDSSTSLNEIEKLFDSRCQGIYKSFYEDNDNFAKREYVDIFSSPNELTVIVQDGHTISKSDVSSIKICDNIIVFSGSKWEMGIPINLIKEYYFVKKEENV